ncbi:MAG: hypothetical protein ACI8QZ_002804 [Chlamydiales bacterium]
MGLGAFSELAYHDAATMPSMPVPFLSESDSAVGLAIGTGAGLSRRCWLLALTAGSTLYWWVAVPVVHAPDFDSSMPELVFACVLKYMCWPACLWLVVDTYRAIGRSTRRSCQAACAWAVASLGIVFAMAFWRGPLADLVRTGTTHLTSPSTYIGYPPLGGGVDPDRVAYDVWLSTWNWGGYLLIESVFFVLLALGHGLLARFGRSLGPRQGGAPLAILMTVSMAWAFTLTFGLMEWTFDLFHHGIAVGCLALELTFPIFAGRPESAVAAPFAFAYALVGAILVTRWERADRARV